MLKIRPVDDNGVGRAPFKGKVARSIGTVRRPGTPAARLLISPQLEHSSTIHVSLVNDVHKQGCARRPGVGSSNRSARRCGRGSWSCAGAVFGCLARAAPVSTALRSASSDLPRSLGLSASRRAKRRPLQNGSTEPFFNHDWTNTVHAPIVPCRRARLSSPDPKCSSP